MNAENITLGTWFGESQEEENGVELRCLNYIKIKVGGKIRLCEYRTDFFSNPPTKDVDIIREIFKVLKLELTPMGEDFKSSGIVRVQSSSESTMIIPTKSGFMSEWTIINEGFKYGTIEEHGNFYDRGADIIIDIPEKNS